MAETMITERFEFKTNILTAYGGNEQRRKLRVIPRHYLSYDYKAMDCFQAQWIRGNMRVRQSDVIYLPMWHNPIRLSQDYIENTRYLYIGPTYMLSLHRCNTILIFKHDNYTLENISKVIESYGDSYIYLKKPLSLDTVLSKKTAVIYPVIECSVQPNSTVDYIYTNGTNTTLNFEDILYTPDIDVPQKYLDNYETYDSYNKFNLPITYNGVELFLNTPQWVDDTDNTLSVDKNAVKLDNDLGVFKYDVKNTKSYDKVGYNIYLQNKKEINNFIRFMNKTSGRFKSFYMPSWVNDFQICKDIQINTNYIYTKFSLLYKYYATNSRAKKLVIFKKDRTVKIITIFSYTTETINNVMYGKLLLSEPFNENLAISNIRMISYLNRVRFDSDSFTFNYETPVVAQVQLAFKEVDDI